MSYMVCPDCGKRLTPFGESRAGRHREGPRHRRRRARADRRKARGRLRQGVIELFDGDWLKDLFGRLEKELPLD
jgi:hypothetical protein